MSVCKNCFDLASDLEELREAVEAAGLEYREDDGPRPYWRNIRAMDAEFRLRQLARYVREAREAGFTQASLKNLEAHLPDEAA